MRTAAMATAVFILTAGSAFADLFDDECQYTAPRRVASSMAGVSKVVVHGDAGSLSVTGTPGANQLIANGTACTSDEDFLTRITLSMTRRGNELHVSSEIPEKTVIFGFFQARLDFSVSLPAGVPVVIDDGSGWIKVSNTGALVIDDGSGSLELKNVRGNVVINDGSGEIDLDGIIGNVTVDDSSGSVIARNITGNVQIEDGSGAIEIARVEGSVRIPRDGSGAITVQNIRGSVIVDDDGSGAIAVADVGGSFTVGSKGSGGIDYERVAGKVSIPRR